MMLRINSLPVEMPASPKEDPHAAKQVQELLGGKFGEMSTLMNYSYQSFSMRARKSIRPYYQLITNIAAEEYGHVEVVTAAINSCLNGGRTELDDADDPTQANWQDYVGQGLGAHYVAAGHNALPVDSNGKGWSGEYVFSSGNLVLDLLSNFFLENGARTQKLKVYQTTDNPAAREMLGYLFVRGAVHAMAYANALESLTGVNMKKMLPIPNIKNSDFPEARKYMSQNMHLKMYKFTQEDITQATAFWSGEAPKNYTEGYGSHFEFVDEPPQSPADMSELQGIASAFTPDYQPEEIMEIANKLYKEAVG